MVCVNYSDFLKITLPYNKHNFDKIHVITTTNDVDTQRICKKYDVNVVITDKLYENGDSFNKGKAINDGIKSLKYQDWILITDADMIMPTNLRPKLESMNLNINCAYGTGRMICRDKIQWNDYLRNKNVSNNWKKQTRRINIGVGFFQLVNFNSETLCEKDGNWYSTKWGHCGRSDRRFWRLFPTENRKSIKDIITIHLGDDNMGANWEGRTTPKW